MGASCFQPCTREWRGHASTTVRYDCAKYEHLQSETTEHKQSEHEHSYSKDAKCGHPPQSERARCVQHNTLPRCSLSVARPHTGPKHYDMIGAAGRSMASVKSCIPLLHDEFMGVLGSCGRFGNHWSRFSHTPGIGHWMPTWLLPLPVPARVLDHGRQLDHWRVLPSGSGCCGK